MRLNDHPGRLRVGDPVTTDFYSEEKAVVRRVTSIRKVDRREYGSGYCIAADGGETCQHCGKQPGRSVPPIDGAWFLLVEAP